VAGEAGAAEHVPVGILVNEHRAVILAFDPDDLIDVLRAEDHLHVEGLGAVPRFDDLPPVIVVKIRRSINPAGVCNDSLDPSAQGVVGVGGDGDGAALRAADPTAKAGGIT